MIIPDKKQSTNPLIGFTLSKKTQLLVKSIIKDDVKTILKLLNVGLGKKTFQNLFYVMIETNSQKVIKFLLDNGIIKCLDQGMYYQQTSPITYAVKNGSYDALRVLQILMAELSVKQAVNLTAKITGINKNQLYKTATKLKNDLLSI